MSASEAPEPLADDDGWIAEESGSRYENLFAGHVLPILKFRRAAEGEYAPVGVAGTGFTFGEHTLVTCWHCVSGELAEDEVYGVAYRSEGLDQPGYDSVSELVDLGQVGERDLALARIGIAVEPRLTLAEKPAAWGEDVVACGYPLPRGVNDPFYRTMRLESNATMLKGYVTRLRLDDRPGWRPVRAYELDMPAPPGVSGSPLFRPHPLEVVGVVYREQDITVPDSERVIYFAYAHHLTTLRAARAKATDDVPLAEYLARNV